LAGLVFAAGQGRTALAEPPVEVTPLTVSVDIRPGLCPNHLRVQSHLTIPIAIMGTMSFEIEQVDAGSIRLIREGLDAELAPDGWAYADVGTPIVGGLCACHKLRGDGIDDLEFYFPIKDVVRTLDLEGHSGETLELTLGGFLVTGEPIRGIDCAMVISGLWEDDDLGDEIRLLDCAEDRSAGQFKFAYQTTVSDRITFAIYDVEGRMVAKLNDMDMAPGIYTATWDGLGQNKEEAPAGIYFARVNNSLASDIRKITLPR
jgi:hypothetical protein